jgi:hypothetical protein
MVVPDVVCALVHLLQCGQSAFLFLLALLNSPHTALQNVGLCRLAPVNLIYELSKVATPTPNHRMIIHKKTESIRMGTLATVTALRATASAPVFIARYLAEMNTIMALRNSHDFRVRFNGHCNARATQH